MTQDLYLRFPDEATATALLFADDRPLYRNIDVIGTLFTTGDQKLIDEDGNEYQVAVPLDGWHVNIRPLAGENIAALEPYRVNPEPATPARVWA